MKNFQVLKELYKPVLNEKKLIISNLFYGLFGGISMVISVYILQITSSYILDINNNNDLTRSLTNILIVLFVGLFLSFMENLIYHKTYTEFTRYRMEMIRNSTEKILKMDFKYYEDPKFLDEIGLIFMGTSTNDSGVEGVYHKMFDISKYIVASIILSYILINASFLIIIILVAALIIDSIIENKIVDIEMSYQKELSGISRKINFYNSVNSDFQYGKDMRLYNPEEILNEYRSKEVEKLERTHRNIINKERLFVVLGSIIIIFAEFLCIYILLNGYGGKLDIPIIVKDITSLGILTVSIKEIIRLNKAINKDLFYAKETLNFLEKNYVTEGGLNSDFSGEAIDIVFENVTFKYPNTDKNILENFNFKIDKEDKLAIVGLNGAGKTTFVKLLMGLYDPDEGRILYNGVDSRELSLESKYKLFAPVFQDINPLAFTIEENVATSQDKEKIKRNRVLDKIAQIGLDSKIDKLDKGIDSMLYKIIDEDGVILSGGENQKLLIARALYKENTSVLILDEPTSSLDALAEEKLYKELADITENKTTVFISHRLASTKFCNKILLIDGGKLAEFGTHEELINNNGLYKKMYEVQGKYYKEVEN